MAVGGLEIGKIISAFTSNPEVSSKLKDLVNEDIETQADGVAKIVKDNAGLELGRDQILGILQSLSHFADSFTIAELTKKFTINQQKLITGFKEIFNMTINEYTKKY